MSKEVDVYRYDKYIILLRPMDATVEHEAQGDDPDSKDD
jgi:hypothetical protein